MATDVLLQHIIHGNDMTCQFACTLCMSNQFNMFATTILTNYTIYVILYHISYFTLHISCIWHDIYAYTPKKFSSNHG